jgi:hypothetical protein
MYHGCVGSVRFTNLQLSHTRVPPSRPRRRVGVGGWGTFFCAETRYTDAAHRNTGAEHSGSSAAATHIQIREAIHGIYERIRGPAVLGHKSMLPKERLELKCHVSAKNRGGPWGGADFRRRPHLFLRVGSAVLQHLREKRFVPFRDFAGRIVFDDPLPRRRSHPFPGRGILEQRRESLCH